MRKLLAAFLLFPPLLVATHAKASFLPEDVLRDAVPYTGPSSIDEAQFRSVLQELQRIYGPIAKAHGGNLSLSGDWKNEKLNAGASQMGATWRVVITGALARRPELTADGFSLILCHEIGHHLAGFPFAAGGNPFQKAWAANEGQSDYFSAQVCARELWGTDRETNAGFRADVPPYVQERCDTAWTEVDAQNLCYRINAAVKSMTDTMAGILKKPAPDFSTPDPAVVPKTSDAHPAVQCRMDTTFQGALCPQAFGQDLIPGKGLKEGVNSEAAESQSSTRTCTSASGHVFGLRPVCWFKARM